MECADRPLRVSLQVVEEGRLVARLNTFEDRQVKFQQFFNGVEDASRAGRSWIRREPLHFAVGGDIDVKIGRTPFRTLASFNAEVSAGTGPMCLDHPAQDWSVMHRPEWHAFGDDDRQYPGIDDGGTDRVLEAADDHGLIDECVPRAGAAGGSPRR